jgi:predicted DNA-binding mobile mystery protein A
LRAIRQALGLSLDEVASNLETNRQSVLKFEKAEAMDRITLRSLKRVAEAMSCELVYAIVPKKGSIVDLAQNDGISKRTRDEITNRVHSVEHTMALEDQATGNAEQAIADETKRILRKRQRT